MTTLAANVAPETSDSGEQARDTGFAWLATLVGGAVIAGAYVDGWAHNHDKVDHSFFTAWHALLYAAVALAGVVFFGAALRNHARGQSWRNSLGRPYRLSAFG